MLLTGMIPVEEDTTLALTDVAAQVANVRSRVDGVDHDDYLTASRNFRIHFQFEFVDDGDEFRPWGLEICPRSLDPFALGQPVEIEIVKVARCVIVNRVSARPANVTPEIDTETILLTVVNVGNLSITQDAIFDPGVAEQMVTTLPCEEIASAPAFGTAETGATQSIFLFFSDNEDNRHSTNPCVGDKLPHAHSFFVVCLLTRYSSRFRNLQQVNMTFVYLSSISLLGIFDPKEHYDNSLTITLSFDVSWKS